MKVKNMKIKYKSLKYIKIVFISLFFALSLLGCSKSSEELVQEKMSESEILLGNQKESFEGLEYKINQDIKKEDSNYYLAGIDNEYPVLEMDVVEEEKDFKEVNSDELERDGLVQMAGKALVGKCGIQFDAGHLIRGIQVNGVG